MNSQAESHRHHISGQFNAELEDVKQHMLEMGGLVEKQLNDALAAARKSDSGLGTRVINADDDVDSMEMKIDEECNLILARRHPAASDLRLVLAIIKTVRDLERIGDESAKVAHMAVKLSEEGNFDIGVVEFGRIGKTVSSMVHMALDAFARYDADAALKVAQQDAEVDEEYGSALRSLITYMMEDRRSISRVVNLLWSLRALERVGDHAKNISEHVIYLVKGMDVRHEDLRDVAEKLVEEDE
ncbi:MAG: phosphate signaling complex protein PhoU [Pseudohongiellaceae bacterium]